MPPTMLPNLAARDTALDPEIHRLCHWSKECIRAHEEADKKKSKGGRTCSGKKDCENAFDDLMMEMRVEIKEKAERRQKAREGKIAAPPPM
ncbi:hypothetical protein SLS58_008449 [Diplodia intermedia]|uniref:Uncharacterized protein n=1 Tax=Diplodia intermedia TaxID=856260 RepID=A0ABR3TH89_9PEZI